MYTDHKKYPNLPKLPNTLEDSLEMLNFNAVLKNAFGKDVLSSYIKLKKSEIESFKLKEKFDKLKPITSWERSNTLDC
jgi:glutamine synthetase